MERERLGSRLGFILLSAGCAIGCGNVWKFPWMTGQNGGAGFVLIYILCLLILGVPIMTMEFSLGRASQASPIKMYQKLGHPNWKFHGIVSLFGNIALMAFYTVVTGWIFNFFIKFLTGNVEADVQETGFVNMITNPGLNVAFLAVVVVLGFFVLSFNLQSGLEKVTKVMMIGLLILMIGLAIYCACLPNAAEGLRFYMVPDFSKVTLNTVVGAMNQAFFTLSIGMGSMAIFGSYIDKERSLLGESVNVIVLDTVVALLAGFIIFPACSSVGVSVDAGPALLFNTMAGVFNSMKGGRILGILFFLFMIFAAFSTVLAVFENILAMVRELTGWGRVKGCIICGIGIFVLGLTTALGFSVLSGFEPFAPGSAFLDFWDFIVSTNILPLGSMIMAVFCTTDFGWGWKNFVAEANTGKGLKIKNWMQAVFNVVPVIVLALWLYGIVTFAWK